MAQEEKLEEAKRLYETANADQRYVLESLFPELKESEDEKIRKWIITQLQFKIGDNVTLDNMICKAIAWLENQGESDEVKAKMFLINKGYPIDTNGIFPTYEEMYNIIKEGLENQGESVVESINEEKIDNANKVEPKFKVGDWITSGDYTWKIVEVKPLDYILQSQDGNIVDDTISFVDEQFHSFTIEDAKDGDVLVSENFIFIFKNIDNGNGVHYYCHYEVSKHEDDNQFDIALPQSLMGRVGNSISHYSPATKEQRYLLMKAMDEAGYTFDFEKKELKELKKVEQKPVTDFSDIRTWKYIVDAVLTKEYGIGNYLDSTRTETIAKELQERFGKIEQKPAWSEEDEKNIACYNPYKAVVESIAEMCKHYDKASHSGLRDFYDNVKVKCKDAKEYDSLNSKS